MELLTLNYEIAVIYSYLFVCVCVSVCIAISCVVNQFKSMNYKQKFSSSPGS